MDFIEELLLNRLATIQPYHESVSLEDLEGAKTLSEVLAFIWSLINSDLDQDKINSMKLYRWSDEIGFLSHLLIKQGDNRSLIYKSEIEPMVRNDLSELREKLREKKLTNLLNS